MLIFTLKILGLSMDNLNLPSFDYRIKNIENKAYIYDVIRKKYIQLTPEEWVRQHFVNYLIAHLNYPGQLMANEVSLRLNSTSKRCDTVVYTKALQPLVIVEYKAPDVELSQAVFNQVMRYNMVLRVKYIIISNGLKHICCYMDYGNNKFHFLKGIPKYEDL